MIGITISQISFNCGETIDLSPSDIVVFVGPNNVGKSQSLRDIFDSLSTAHGGVVVKDVDILYHNPDKLEDRIKTLSLTTRNRDYYMYGGYKYSIYSALLESFGKHKKIDENVKKFLVSMVQTEERLTTSDPKQMVNPGHVREFPLQYVTESDNRDRMSDIFEKIFSRKVYCEDKGSTMLSLHMGEDIDFDKTEMTVQQVSDEYYRQIGALPLVHEQGDGIRSLAGLLLNMMMPNYSVFLIDEPEAFLHPPQAMVLGEDLPTLLGDRQAFISTHSIELIKGLLTKASQRVRIIRLTRTDNINSVHYLKPEDLNTIWKDPIIRHSNILDGLFYHHLVLCESDSDCQLYAAMLSHIKEEQNTYGDTLFTLCNGKGRMKTVSKMLKSLGVDYRIVPDIDFFNDKGIVKAVYENCGGEWADVERDYKILFDAMNQPDGTMTPDDFTKAVRKMIDLRGWVEMTKPYASKLGKELPKLLASQWDLLKRDGIDSIKDTVVREAAERLVRSMNDKGIYPVTDGELESFFPDVESHGPGYAVAVLTQYPDLNAPEYNRVRATVESWGI